MWFVVSLHLASSVLFFVLPSVGDLRLVLVMVRLLRFQDRRLLGSKGGLPLLRRLRHGPFCLSLAPIGASNELLLSRIIPLVNRAPPNGAKDHEEAAQDVCVSRQRRTILTTPRE